MGKLEKYDKTNPLSIENYGQELIGKTFRDVIRKDEMLRNIDISESDMQHESINLSDKRAQENKDNKGNLGQIIEEKHFHYMCNNDSRPDFHEAGVELKVTPYKINPNGKKVAKERLILTMIDYFSVVNEEFETSHLWNKSKLILLVYYLYLKETQFRLDYKIDYVKLFTPPEQDIKIIKHDYDVIVKKIKAGKAHELSERDFPGADDQYIKNLNFLSLLGYDIYMKKKIMERIIDEMAAEQAKEQEQTNGKEKKIKEENKRKK